MQGEEKQIWMVPIMKKVCAINGEHAVRLMLMAGLDFKDIERFSVHFGSQFTSVHV
jgi:hypothetical protein